jgi:membrane-associated phospholipid phosphatase
MFLAVATLFGGPGGASAQVATRITLYGSDTRSYTSWGSADETGSVIVFDSQFAAPAPAKANQSNRSAAADLSGFQSDSVMRVPRSQPVSMYPYGSAQTTGTAPTTGSNGPADPKPDSTLQPVVAGGAAGGVAGETAAGAGEATYSDGLYLIDTDYLLSYPKNFYRMFTGPLRYDRDDWINVAFVVGIGGALILLDEPLNDLWRGSVHSGATEALSDAFRPLGDSDKIIIASLGAYTVAELLDSIEGVDLKREKTTALLTLESFLLTQTLITGLKYASGRERPSDTESGFDFSGPSMADFNASFPSGHAGAAFSVASVISEMYGPENPWVPWIAYTAATGTALARVDDNRHWFSDVFVGSAIGYFVGKMVVRYNPFLERNHITLRPFRQNDAQGVALSYRY